ncbi:hypothetical protein ACQEVZ_46390 [Dactylosporangium sp. CA-152071]|uniref:hypothetical protein n=1 Tax=Dactylosporangium sp. CA-152071 TaxID=3239933 RepID=UPI003D8B9ED9
MFANGLIRHIAMHLGTAGFFTGAVVPTEVLMTYRDRQRRHLPAGPAPGAPPTSASVGLR